MLYLAAMAIVFAVNLMPVLGPPTWAVLILLMLNWHLNAAALVILGAIGAGGGRYVLALASRALRHKVGERRRENLRAAQQALTGHKLGAVAGIGLFALSPLPSAQLFEAAGILELPLVPITTAFFAGRIVSYSIYVSSASLAAKHYGNVISSALTSPTGITLQVAMLVALVLLAEVDWRRVIARVRARRAH